MKSLQELVPNANKVDRQPRSPLSTSFPLFLASSTSPSPSPPLLLYRFCALDLVVSLSGGKAGIFPDPGARGYLPDYAIGWQR